MSTVALTSCFEQYIHASHCNRVTAFSSFQKGGHFFDGSARTDPLIYRYELACCYCMQLEFKKAAEIFKVLVRAENFQVSEMCAHQLISYRNMCEIFVHSNWLDVAQCWMKCAMIVVGSGDIAALYHT
jgi:hypothetical protein